MRSSTTHPDTIDGLLLLCLKGQPSTALQEALEAEWEELARRAAKHRVAGLVYQRLEQLQAAHSGTALPAAVAENLSAAYLSTALRNMQLFAELHHVLQAFQGAEIQVVVLKGAYLVQSVFCNPGVRWMNDLDLLVRNQDLAKAGQELARLGFRPEGNQEWYTRNHFHYQYIQPERGVRVELHWHLEPPNSPFTMNMGQLWDRTRPVSFAGSPALALSPEDLLLHLSLQVAYQHPFDYFALRTMADIAALISLEPGRLDWTEMVRRAGEWQAQRCAHLTLRLAQKLFDCEIPEEALAALEPEGFSHSLVGWAEERIFAVGEELAYLPEPEAMSERFGRFLASEGAGARAMALVHSLFPSPTVIRQLYRLPAGSLRTPWYYLVRMKDLVKRHRSKALRLAGRDPNTLVWARLESRRIALVSWMTPPAKGFPDEL